APGCRATCGQGRGSRPPRSVGRDLLLVKNNSCGLWFLFCYNKNSSRSLMILKNTGN
ncbi:unnamed protein product, partial [Gulo gulo]